MKGHLSRFHIRGVTYILTGVPPLFSENDATRRRLRVFVGRHFGGPPFWGTPYEGTPFRGSYFIRGVTYILTGIPPLFSENGATRRRFQIPRSRYLGGSNSVFPR